MVGGRELVLRACQALPLVVALVVLRAPAAQAAEVAGDTLTAARDTKVAGDTLTATRAGEAPPGTAAGVASTATLRRWQGALFRPDRLSHASLALGLGVGVGMLSRAPAAGAAAAIGLGLAKELGDDHVDRGDLAADVIGAGLAALVVAALTR